MNDVIIVENLGTKETQDKMKHLMSQGYKVSSSACGLYGEEYNYSPWYIAIMVRESKVGTV